MLYISYRSFIDECKDRCKKNIIELIGWTGSISVISAYTLTTTDNDNLLLIDILNLYGSAVIGYMCFRAKVWQAATLEVAWFGVGVYSMIDNIINDYDTPC